MSKSKISTAHKKLEEIVEDPGNEDGKTPYKDKSIAQFKGEEQTSIKKLRLKPMLIETGRSHKDLDSQEEQASPEFSKKLGNQLFEQSETGSAKNEASTKQLEV